MDKLVFDKDKEKKKSSFSSFLAVKKLKIGIHSLLVQAQQTIFFYFPFYGNSQILLMPSKKETFQSQI